MKPSRLVTSGGVRPHTFAVAPKSMTSPSPPPGWYPHPSGEPGQRYFDGNEWTQHRAGAPGPPPYGQWRELTGPPGAGIPWRQISAGFWVMIVSVALLFGAISASLGAVLALALRTSEPITHSIQEVRDGKLAFTLINVETASKAEHIDAQGKFVIVTMNVKNIGDAPHTYKADEQKLIDSAGREHEVDSPAATVLNPEDTTKMNPGFGITVELPFDIPVDATPAVLEVHDFILSGGNVIRIP